jgi:glycosyl transferase family 87
MAETLTAPQGSHRRALIALALALVAASSMLEFHLGLFLPRVLEARAARGLGNGYAFGCDFYPIWLAERQWRIYHLDPYSAETTREIQKGLFGRPLDARNQLDPPADYRSFAYPAFTELLFWPTAALKFPALRILLAVLLPLLTVWGLWFWMRALQWSVHGLWFAVIATLLLCSYPMLEAFFAEQPGVMVGFLLAASALALRRNRLLLAGTLLALTFVKPQMTALAVFYLLMWSFEDRRRRGKLAAGFLATALLLLGGSLLIWPRWIGAWLRIILGYHRYATPPLASEVLGPTLSARVGPVVIAAIFIAGVVIAWRNRKAGVESLRFRLTLSLLLAITSVTLLPGQAVYDHVILLPGILLVLQHRQSLSHARRMFRTLCAIAAVVLLWPWIAALALVVTRPWIAPQHFYSTAVFALPIRTAGSFPFAVLALLAYASRISGTALPEPVPGDSSS